MDSIENIKKYGKDSTGKTYLLKYLQGQALTMKQAILAECFSCGGYYADGRKDCHIPECPLYPFMPYRTEKNKVKKVRSEKQIEASRKLSLFRSTTYKTMRQMEEKG